MIASPALLQFFRSIMRAVNAIIAGEVWKARKSSPGLRKSAGTANSVLGWLERRVEYRLAVGPWHASFYGGIVYPVYFCCWR